jgi:ankyrin repeat protein
MPIRNLPEDPSFEHLKKQAKRLLAAARAGDSEAIAHVSELHPRGRAALERFTLSEAQLVIARAHGLSSWAALKRQLEVVERFSFTPATGARQAAESNADRLVRLACLDYGDDWHPALAERARELLADSPDLAHDNIHAAAATGDVAAARSLLSDDPALVNRKGGPLNWEPLLYACYSRLDGPAPTHSTVDVARLLLAAGADPNAGFLWRGLVPPFTALTGAFGEGENGRNQPPHPHRDVLTRLLLDAGADPNDGQTLYNRHFTRDDGHLRLLFEYGLGEARGGPWFARLGERLQTPSRMLVEELWAAAGNNFPDRVRLLVEHGVDVNTPGSRNGRTPYEQALRAGNVEIAEYLAAHGGRRIELAPDDILASALVAGRESEVRRALADDPASVDRLGRQGRAVLLHSAVQAGHPEGVRLMAALGFEVDGLTRNTPMHEAAWRGDLGMVQLLAELGANPSVRDTTYHATPLGWAAHNQQLSVVDYLLPRADIFDAVRFGSVERVEELLRDDPALVNAVDAQGRSVESHLASDTPHFETISRLLTGAGEGKGS